MNSTRPPIRIGAFAIRFLVEARTPAAAPRCSSATSQPMPRCPFRTATTVSRRPSTGWRGVTTFTVDGEAHEIGPGGCLCIRRGQVTASITTGPLTRSSSRSPPRCVRTRPISRRWPRSSLPPRRSPRSRQGRRGDAPPRAHPRKTCHRLARAGAAKHLEEPFLRPFLKAGDFAAASRGRRAPSPRLPRRPPRDETPGSLRPASTRSLPARSESRSAAWGGWSQTTSVSQKWTLMDNTPTLEDHWRLCSTARPGMSEPVQRD